MTGPVRLGLIGCGEVTRAKHLPAIAGIDGLRVTALCDVDEGACAIASERFPVARRYTDPFQMLRSADLDAVGVSVPTPAHADLAVAALEAAKHVWIDKPLALTVDGALRIIAAARRVDVVAMTGHHMRFHRLVRQARELIRTGALGRIESVRVVWHSPRGDANIPKWKTSRADGGGAVMEIAVHHFDLLRFLLDTEIDELFALSLDGVRQDECAVVSGRLSNGALIAGEFSERSAHEIEIVVNGHDRVLRVDCLRFDGLECRETRLPPGSPKARLGQAAHLLRELPSGLAIMRQGGDYRISYRAAWSHFADAIRNGRAVESTLEDGLRAVYATCAAVESGRQGVPVRLAGIEDRVPFGKRVAEAAR